MRRAVSSESVTLEDARAERPRGFAASAEFGERRVVLPRVVRIRDGALEWSNEEPGWDHRRSLAEYEKAGLSPWVQGKSDDDLLKRFIRLANAPEDAFVTFARRYGVLYLNAAGVPSDEPEMAEYPDETAIHGGVKRAPGGGVMIDRTPRIRPVRWRREPMTLWRDWALLVRLLLLYGLKLRDATARIDPIALLAEWGLEVPPYVDDNDRWSYSEPRFLVAALAWTPTRLGGDDYRPTTLTEQRLELGGWLDLLASRSSARLRVSWRQGSRPWTRIGRPREDDAYWLSTDPNDVFGDVVGQLLTMLVGGEKVHICPGCGTPYLCKSRRGFCPACRADRRKATRRATWNRHPEYNDRRRRPRTATG